VLRRYMNLEIHTHFSDDLQARHKCIAAACGKARASSSSSHDRRDRTTSRDAIAM
jgi:hypothetical protein